MSKSLNEVKLIGNLGSDPEVKSFDNDKKVVRVSLACNFEFTPKGATEKTVQTEWVTCEAWNGLGGVLAQYAKKGDRIYVSGRLKTDKYKDEAGVERFFTKVVVEDLILLGGANGSARNEAPMPSEDEIPF